MIAFSLDIMQSITFCFSVNYILHLTQGKLPPDLRAIGHTSGNVKFSNTEAAAMSNNLITKYSQQWQNHRHTNCDKKYTDLQQDAYIYTYICITLHACILHIPHFLCYPVHLFIFSHHKSDVCATEK